MSEERVRYGMDAEIHEKMMAKLDPEVVRKALEWISTIIEEPVADFYPSLKNGAQLCKLLNKIKPGTVKKYSAKTTHVLQERENVQAFLNGCVALGVPSHELFTISDLQEGKSIPSVLVNIYSLGRQAQVTPGFDGPRLGVRYTVTAEEQEKRAEKKKLEVIARFKMAVAQESKRASRREEVEREKKLEALQDRKVNDEKLLARKLKKGRLTEKEYKQLLKKLHDQYQHDIQHPEEAQIDIGAVVFGMDLEHQKKMREKLDQDGVYEAMEDLMDWLEEMTGDPIDDLHKNLRTGVVLCKLINKLRPGYIKKIDTRAYTSLRFGPSVSRDNIKLYLEACARMGVASSELFNISDLYDAKDIAAVMKNLEALRRLAPTPVAPLHTISEPDLTPATKPPIVTEPLQVTQSEPQLIPFEKTPAVDISTPQATTPVVVETPKNPEPVEPVEPLVVEQPLEIVVVETPVTPVIQITTNTPELHTPPATQEPKKSNFKKKMAIGIAAGLLVGAGIYIAYKKPALPKQIFNSVVGFFQSSTEKTPEN